MTNHWADIANTTLVLVWGANPVENHPACIAHVNRARFPKQFFPASDSRSNKKPAQLIVIDPRKNRTALQCNETDTSKPAAERDRYVRIRPGTDIALQNGLLRYIIGKMEALPVGNAVRDGFFAHLDQSSANTFFTDGTQGSLTVTDEAVVLTGTAATTVKKANIGPGTLVVRSAVAGGGTLYTEGANAAAAADYFVNYAAGTITRCTASTIPAGGTVYASYTAVGSYLTTLAGGSKYTDARFIADSPADYRRAVANSGTPDQMSLIPVKAANVHADTDTVYNRLMRHVAPYTPAVVASICGCTEADIAFIGDAYIAHSKCTNGVVTTPGATFGEPSVKDARDPNFRATTILYAMGITQHTCGSQNIKGFANLQTLMGNMGRQGGGINALRGIHNVQGSTDMGLLYGNIPAYSGNPGTQPSTDANAFGKYMDGLWGNPLSGTGVRTTMNNSYDDAYVTTAMNLQQRGFYNMTLKWFADYGTVHGLSGAAKRAAVDAAYSLWPKGNGHDHITMFRDMKKPLVGQALTRAALIWGQNPAVTEPNQGAIRDGLYDLDTMVVVDMFETETAAVSRKATGETYLIPTASYPEKAGSSTNSGRTLQWRYQAMEASGNTKDDNELLLRFAKAFDTAGVFSHISTVWTASGIASGNVYTQLWGTPYGGYLGTGTGFNALSGDGELVKVRSLVSDTVTYDKTAGNLKGSEWVAEKVYREFASPLAAGGTMWIYTGAYNAEATAATGGPWTTANIPTAYGAWEVSNRAKSRDRRDPAGQLAFHGWGYAWLVNRRVFYNNKDVPGDVDDFYMEPDSVSRLFVPTTPPALLGYSRWYRKYHNLADKPSTILGASPDLSSPHFAGGTVSYAGAFPGHTEPYETPRQELLAAGSFGRNTKGGNAWDLVRTDTKVAGRDLPADKYPLVLTTIRCVEHFQGGPITRNNPWNVELEPEPWIEINSVDARANNIVDGDLVKIVTARTEGVGGATVSMMPQYGAGWRARVGVGLSTNQRVGVGVVAIPWHWGEKGLSSGSRANDITMDSFDANSTIPEYKACLCRLEKM